MLSIFDACYAGDLSLLQQLIASGSRTDTKDNRHSRTPLQWAIIGEHTQIVSYLLALNIERNIELLMDHRDKYKKTAKDYAVVSKRHDKESQLLDLLSDWKQKKFCPILATQEPPRHPCAWRLLRTKLMPVDTKVIYYNGVLSERYPICSETLHSQLTHYSRKTGALKWYVSLDTIHHQLRSDVMKMANTEGNIIAVDITIEFKIDTTSTYQAYTFPLKIVGCDIFTMSDAHDYVKICNHTFNAYSVLKHLYEQGQTLINGDHGHHPHYELNNPSHAQFKNHSEQALAAYLSTPAAAQHLVNYFNSSLRTKNVMANSSIKVYLVALHIHSNKTPCGACEQVLLGMQNTVTVKPQIRGRYFGFIEQLEAALLEPNDNYRFRIPTRVSASKKGGIRCLVTSSADSNDSTHRTLYPVHRTLSNEPTVIDTSNSIAAKNLHVARFQPDNVVSFQKGRFKTYVDSRTFFSSASKSNKKTPEKEKQYQRLYNQEALDLSDDFARMGL